MIIFQGLCATTKTSAEEMKRNFILIIPNLYSDFISFMDLSSSTVQPHKNIINSKEKLKDYYFF